MRAFIALIIAGLVLGGCGPASNSTDETANKVTQAEQRITQEREQRQTTETRLQEQQERASRWQIASALSVSLAVIALIVGAILGSRARHDAEK